MTRPGSGVRGGRILALIVVCVFASPAVSAEPGLLDLIPANALFAVGTPNLAAAEKKADRLFKEGGLDPGLVEALGDLTELLEHAFKTKVVRDRAVLFGMASAEETFGKPLAETMQEALELVFVAFVIEDADKLARGLGLDPKDLAGGTILKGPSPMWLFAERARWSVRGRTVYFAPFGGEKSLPVVLKAKPLATTLPEGQRRDLASNDIAFLIGREGVRSVATEALKGYRETLSPAEAEEMKPTLEALATAAGRLRFAVGSLRGGEGIGVNVGFTFDGDADRTVAKLLAMVGAGPGAAAFTGLPAGDVVLAQALRGDGQQNARLTRLFSDLVFPNTGQAERLVTSADRPAVRALLAGPWRQLRGERLAVYPTTDPKLGRFAGVAVLDTADPAAFLAELASVVRLGDPKGLDLKPGGDDRALVEKLIRDLADDAFETREAASAKLRLLGDPALAPLEQATKSDDAEVRRRAAELLPELRAEAEQFRKDLAAGRFAQRVRPTFTFFPAVEKRGDHAVGVMRVGLEQKDQPIAAKLTDLLGPEWDRVRMVVVGTHVVLLVGSDVGLLDRTLATLAGKEPPLAKGLPAVLQPADDPARKLEGHFSFAALANFLGAGTPAKGKSGLTSAAMSIESDRLRIDVWVPISEMNALGRLTGLAK